MRLPNSISRRSNANGTQTMPHILILFLLVAGVGACHPAYPTVADDELKPSPGGPLTARFFGVSTILLDDGKSAIMTDGFFSRPAAGKLPQRRDVVLQPAAVLEVAVGEVVEGLRAEGLTEPIDAEDDAAQLRQRKIASSSSSAPSWD